MIGRRSESRVGLWLRWSWRDLRSRWIQVAAIATIIALGVGVYAGLGSMKPWREANYDASYEALRVHDLLVTTAAGTYVEQGALEDVLASTAHPGWYAHAEERLVVKTQVDASAEAGKTVLVPGRIVGVDVRDGGPHVDEIHVVGGRGLRPSDAGKDKVVLDSHFAEHYELPPRGTITLSSGPVRYVGTGYSPEYFTIVSDNGSFLAEAGFAVMFSSIETTQQLANKQGQVNELAIRLAPGVDPRAAKKELAAALESELPKAATDTEWIKENRQYVRIYADIDGDQKLFNIFAVLVLAGAAFAAFNLTGRIVEAQRREIGIGMSLGLPRVRIAIRPLLVGLQISLLGVLFGVAFGWFVGRWMSALNIELLPLPVWNDPFQPAVFLRGAALALVLTFGATVYPVWRAVRVRPIEAIRTGPTIVKAGGFASLLRRVPLPGNSIQQFPFRNVVRAPRRTLLTVAGIAAAIAVLIAVIGLVDSMFATIDRGQNEVLGSQPERVSVSLDSFYSTSDPRVASLAEVAGVRAAEDRLQLPMTLKNHGKQIEGFVTLTDFTSRYWHPTAIRGSLDPHRPGIVISQKASTDLGVGVGDTVTVRHPKRVGLGYTYVESKLPVLAIHPNPYRFLAFMDISQAGLFDLEGVTNSVSVTPEPGVSAEQLERRLFGRPGVAAVEAIADVADTIRKAVQRALGILDVVEVAVLLLAVLIAFNSTSISADERRREHATMFAFGLPTSRVLWLTVIESTIIGALGTISGVVLGQLILTWLVKVLLPTTVPDIGIVIDVSLHTYLTAAVLGTLAVGLAPLLTLRRYRGMDIPSNLRVVE